MGVGSNKIKLNESQEYMLKKQLRNIICKISVNDKEKGYGFLCYFPKSKSRMLITDTFTFNKKDINDKSILELINKKNYDKKKKIDINIPRASFMNEDKKIMLLEIKDEDILNDDYFAEFDENINVNNANKYIDKKIYLLPYNLENSQFPTGKIININEKDDSIMHNFEKIIKENSYGPILLLDNFKVIGINQNKTKGIFLKNCFGEFEKVKELLNEEEERKKKEEERKKKEEEEEERKKKEEEEEEERKKKEEEEERKKKEEEEERKKRKKEGEKIKNKIIIKINIKSNDICKGMVYFFDKDFNCKRKGKGELCFMKDISEYGENKKLNITFPNNKQEKDLSFKNEFKPSEEDKNGNKDLEYKIEIEFNGKIKHCGYMFYDCCNITEVDLTNFDMSDVTDMKEMFNYCTNLKNIKFSGGVIEKVTNMNYMFNYCKNLEEIYLGNFKTDRVTSMGGMFQHCEKLKKIDLSRFDTESTVQLGCMFNDCYNLEEIILSNNFTVSKALFLPWMFYGCEKLEKLDLKHFVFEKAMDLTQLFEGCDKLDKIIVDRKYIDKFKKLYKGIQNKFVE